MVECGFDRKGKKHTRGGRTIYKNKLLSSCACYEGQVASPGTQENSSPHKKKELTCGCLRTHGLPL